MFLTSRGMSDIVKTMRVSKDLNTDTHKHTYGTIVSRLVTTVSYKEAGSRLPHTDARNAPFAAVNHVKTKWCLL